MKKNLRTARKKNYPPSTPQKVSGPPSPRERKAVVNERRTGSGPLAFWMNLSSLILGALGMVLLAKKSIPASLMVLGAGLLAQAVKAIPKGSPGQWDGTAQRKWTALGWVLLPASWAAFSLVMLTFPNSNWLYPPSAHWFFHESFGFVLAAFLVMVAAFRYFPRAGVMEDIPASWSWVLLLTILAVAAALRLYHASVPVISYWDDPARDITWPRQMFDLGDFTDAFIFEPGHTSGEPLFFYFTWFLWHLVPDMRSIYVQRLAATLVDLGTLTVLYFLGREVANRRVGLFLAFTGALSKAMVMKCIDGLRVITMPFAVALALLAFFRLIKKPNLSRFFQWGAAVALGTYTYSSYRPMAPFFLAAGLAWVLYQQPKSKNGRKLSILAGATFLAIIFYFWYTVMAGHTDNWISRIVDVSGSWLACMVAGLFLVAVSLVFLRLEDGEKESPMAGWILGTMLCVVLTVPVMTNSDMLDKVRGYLHFDQTGWGFFKFILGKLGELGTNLFLSGMDQAQPDFGIGSDSLFAYAQIVLIGLGLAFLVARPDWKKIFLFGTALAGISNVLIPSYSYSARVISCIPPLFLLGVLGLEELQKRLLVGQIRAVKWIVAVLALIFSAWTAQGVLSRCYTQFASNYQVGLSFNRMRAYQQAMRDQGLGDRVYIDDVLAHCIETGGGPAVLFEGHPVYIWHEFNPIYMPQGKSLPDLAILLAPESTKLKEEISKAFPGIQWEELRIESLSDKPLCAYHCVIPAAQWTQAPSWLLKLYQIPGPSWTRTFFKTVNGLGVGVVDAEDRTPHAADPIPSIAHNVGSGKEAVRLSADILIMRGGKYALKADSKNLLLVRVDGRRVLDLKFSRTAHYDYEPDERIEKATLKLAAGDHELQVTECYEKSESLPSLTLGRSGDPKSDKSVWDSFAF
jgi:hypothetical protein